MLAHITGSVESPIMKIDSVLLQVFLVWQDIITIILSASRALLLDIVALEFNLPGQNTCDVSSDLSAKIDSHVNTAVINSSYYSYTTAFWIKKDY